MENKWEIKIYKAESWNTEIQVKFENDTVWLTQEQISIIFWVNRPAITKHINNIFESWELNDNQTCSILEQVKKEWKKQVKRKIKYYNLETSNKF